MLSSQRDIAWTEIKAHLCRTEEKREAPKKMTCDFNAIHAWDGVEEIQPVISAQLSHCHCGR